MSDGDKYAALREALDNGLAAINAAEARLLLADLDAANAQLDAIREAMGGYPDSDLVSLATTLKARDAECEELEATCAALTLRNGELQRMVDAGLERSSEAAREAVKR